MALKPKLEFYRIKLVPKNGEYKTFKDFAVDELYQRRPSSDAQIMNKLFDHFINKLVTDTAKSSSLAAGHTCCHCSICHCFHK